jgi:hypothetical protein
MLKYEVDTSNQSAGYWGDHWSHLNLTRSDRLNNGSMPALDV